MGQYEQDSIYWVEVGRIEPNPYQPRREFDAEKLKELADSIRMYGLLQPITVTRKETAHEDGSVSVGYELISGERRLRASKLAGLAQIPVIIHTAPRTEEEKFELAIIENLQREDLSLLDRATAFDRLAREFGYNKADIARKIGKSREYASNTIRVLGLPEYILQYVREGKIFDGHTRPLLMIAGNEEEQRRMTEEIVAGRMSVREAETTAQRIAQDKVRKDKHRFAPELVDIEKTLSERLNTRVRLEMRDAGGRLVISFFTPEDLRHILGAMQASDMQGAVEGVLPQKPAQAADENTIPEDGVSSVATPILTAEHTPENTEASSPHAAERASDDDLYSLRNFSV